MGTFKTSTIRLYQATPSSNWELLPHKLFIVDDIESYLATKTFNTYTLVQYQKPTLELSIVLDLSQTYAEPLNSGFKYARIENSDDTGHYYYYFIKSIDWRAKSAVRFNLVMDVLNTFKEGTHYSFKDSTKISREHKDRFLLGGTVTCTVDMDYYITDSGGSIDVDDVIGVIQDGVLLFEAKVLNIDQYQISLQVDNLTEEQITALIDSSESTTFSIDNDNFIVADIDEPTISETENRVMYRNIDYVPENINPTLQCGNTEGSKIENGNDSVLRDDWYLLYRNENDPDPNEYVNPVECYLIPKTSKKVSIGVITSGRVTSATLETGKYYYVSVQNSDGVTLSNGITMDENYGESYLSGKFIEIFKNADGSLTVTFFARTTTLSQDPYFEAYNVEYITLNRLPEYYVSYTNRPEQSAIINGWSGLTKSTWDSSNVGVEIDPITLLDRTDAKNIKLIKLPYVPYNFTVTSDKINITATNWNYVDLVQADNTHLKCLKLNDLNTDLTTEWQNVTVVPVSNLLVNTVTAINPQNTDLRKGSTYESKLFNSEFYRPTFYYDSFQFIPQLEKCNMSYYMSNALYTSQFKIKFDMTKTINSRFMFSFPDYKLRNGNENYAKFMPIARNNEEVLYNVPYINYVRTGYNYDVKSKNIATQSTWLGVAASGIGMAASFIMPSAPLKALGIVTSLITMAMTVKNAVVTTVQNEESINRKLKEAEMQTASVSGSDDVDLMSVYAENRLKYLVYGPTDIMKTMLYNLFFFAGYNSQRMGLPSHNTRLNFDYLECDAVINKIANVPDDCLSELINSFKNGVTYIHKTNRTTDKWDFDQKYENWEKSLGVE